MRRSCFLLLQACLCAGSLAAEAATLTTIAEVRALSRSEAAKYPPVRLRAVVMIYDRIESVKAQELYIHDGTAGIYVEAKDRDFALHTGDAVEVVGSASPGYFAPDIRLKSLTVVGTGPLPKTHPVTMRDVLSGREDCQWVEITGVVRQNYVKDRRRKLTLLVEDKRVTISFPGDSYQVPEDASMIGSKVALDGVVTGVFNKNAQMVDVRCIHSPALDAVRVLQPASDPFAANARPLSEVGEAARKLQATEVKARAGRIEQPPNEQQKTSGIVTCHRPGTAVFLTDGTHALMAKSNANTRLSIGDRVEVVGFPSRNDDGPVLEDCQVRPTGAEALATPPEVTSSAALDGQHDFSLVTMSGQLADRVMGKGDNDKPEQWLLLKDGDMAFCARLPERDGGIPANVQTGDTLRLTGVITRDAASLEQKGRPGWHPARFQLLLRSPQDVAVVPWLTATKIALGVGFASLPFLGVLFWNRQLRRKVQAQTKTIREQANVVALKETQQLLADDFHDSISAGIDSASWTLDAVSERLESVNGEVASGVMMARRMLRRGIADLRGVISIFKSGTFAERDLGKDLLQSAYDNTHHLGIKVEDQVLPLQTVLPLKLAHELFFLGSEAIANAAKHAQAQCITVHLSEANGLLSLQIIDDGRGFDPNDDKAGHYGVGSMRQRARRIKAKFNISSSSEGTHITVACPLPS